MTEKLWKSLSAINLAAERARKDISGNDITATYATKSEVSTGLGDKLDTTAFSTVSGKFLTGTGFTHNFAGATADISQGASLTVNQASTVSIGGHSEFGLSNNARLSGSDSGLTFGYNTITVGSLSVGYSNSALQTSLSQGNSNSADTYAFAQGDNNKSRSYSLAQGDSVTANIRSIAQGENNSAAIYSQAFGLGTVVTNSGMAIGAYNKTSSDVSLVIGNGTSNSNRSDLFVIKHDGTVSSTGDIVTNDKSLSSVYDTVNSNSGTWNTVTDKVNTSTYNAAMSDINDNFASVEYDIDYLSAAIDNLPSQAQSDWDETDPTSPAYIANKPDLDIYATTADVDAVSARLDDKIDEKVDTATYTQDMADIDANFDKADADIEYLSGAIDNIPAQVQSDWTEADTSSPAFIKNKPADLAMSAGTGIAITETSDKLVFSVSGNYADATEVGADINFLSGAIDNIPAQVQSDWAETDPASLSYIVNKPNLDDYATTATVADISANLSAKFDDKVDTATYVQDMSDIDDNFDKADADINFLSGAIDSIPAQVQSDWTEADTSSPAYIQNKPTSLSMSAGTGIAITETSDTLTFSVSGDYATNTALAGKIDKVTSATSGNVTIFGANGTIEDSKFAADHLVNLKIKDDYSQTKLANYLFLDSREYLLIAGNSGNNVIVEDVEGYLLTEDEKKSIPAAASVNNQLVTTTAMAAAIANFGGFDVVTVDQSGYPDVSTPDTKTIYLTKDSTVTGDDKFKQWIWEAGDTTATPPVPSAWELIGDTTMNLAGYIQCPATYTAGHIVQFTANSAISDTGYTVSDLQNVQADWTETVTTSDSYIQNKPTFTTAAAGTDGVSVSMAGTTFTALTAHQTIPQQVQADWNAVDPTTASYIQNKPDVLIPVSSSPALGGIAAPTHIMVVTAMPAAANIDPNTIYLVQGTIS